MSTRIAEADDGTIVTRVGDGPGRTRVEICGREVVAIRCEDSAYQVACGLLAWALQDEHPEVMAEQLSRDLEVILREHYAGAEIEGVG